MASLSGQNASVNANTSKTEKYRLVWFEDPTTTATFVWNQLEGDPATLHYGLKNEGRNKSKYAERKEVDRVVEYDGMRNCMVTLESLKPDSWYFMCLGDGAGVSRLFYFRTAPKLPKRFTFIWGGD
jgi:phosphodiesterase/alkaline phosphatase D-like protein